MLIFVMDQLQKPIFMSPFKWNPSRNHIMRLNFPYPSVPHTTTNLTTRNSLNNLGILLGGITTTPHILLLPRQKVRRIKTNRFLNQGNINRNASRTDSLHSSSLSNLKT